ncbi:MAG: hypothetical protein OXG09_10070 [Chloroflexi bacterium]|nr:hypothetical protein [Chloroflexota bacterium]
MMDMEALRLVLHEIYEQDRQSLAETGTIKLLERGEQWQLASVLDAGGVLVFPHASIIDCGHQQAACVQAALDCGADTILLVSVLHAFTAEMEAAQARVDAGGEPSAEVFWGFQGPGIEGPRQEWRGDHVLVSWRYLWDAELRRRGLPASRAPRVIERYPFLTKGQPENLPGFEELARLAEGAAVVSTADSHHHGAVYGMPAEEVHEIDSAGLEYARAVLQEGIDQLSAGDYAAYDGHCQRVVSDARDAGPVFHALRPQVEGQILELVGSDAQAYFPGEPPPIWVACALVSWE